MKFFICKRIRIHQEGEAKKWCRSEVCERWNKADVFPYSGGRAMFAGEAGESTMKIQPLWLVT